MTGADTTRGDHRARPRLTMLILAASALALAFLVHGQTLGFGFDYDDYHIVRPHRLIEVLGSFHDTWDSTGNEVRFYRPLTVAFFAVRFELLGFEPAAYHALSIVLFGVAAWLFGVFVFREFRSPVAAVGAAFLFIVHPAMPNSLVAWTTNQMHLLSMIVMLLALLWWQAHRGTSTTGWWWVLLAFEAVGFLIKEDGLLLLPCVLALHAGYKVLVDRSLRWPGALFLLAAVTLIGGLILLRQSALGGVGGYGIPGPEVMRTNLRWGPERLLLQTPARRPGQWILRQLLIAFYVCGILCAPMRRVSRETRFWLLGGLFILVVFDVPTAARTKPEQLHLMALGAAVFTAAIVWTIHQALGGWRLSILLVAPAVLVMLGTMTLVSVNISRDYSPCGSIVLAHDDVVLSWGVVPAEIKEWMRAKRERRQTRGSPCPEPSTIPAAVWGVYEWGTDAAGTRARMTSDRVTILVQRDIHTLWVRLRAVNATPANPATVRVAIPFRPVVRTILTDDQWVRIPVRPAGGRPLFSRMNRIDLFIDPVAIPARVDPASNDPRTLGVMLGELSLSSAR